MTAEREAAAAIVDLYDRRAEDWIVDRGERLTAEEQVWIDRFAGRLAPGDRVLDVGCGSGRPIASALLARGLQVTGIDASPRLIEAARHGVPGGEFQVADMRDLDLGRTFAGVLAWHSLFHLTPADQEVALPRLLAHAAPQAVVMFTSGLALGHVVGAWRGEPLYHGSLSPDRYRAVLERAGFEIEHQPVQAEVAGGPWLARRLPPRQT